MANMHGYVMRSTTTQIKRCLDMQVSGGYRQRGRLLNIKTIREEYITWRARIHATNSNNDENGLC